ncbi:MAG TPA: anti-sigma factor [Solirubrobacteraceae bacterium]|nr:anti-sigma factor [Solirubrobacteraceae bacterium]
MSMPDHNRECEQSANAAVYVLGALEVHELEPYRAHLADCAVCRREVSQLQAVADSLQSGVPRLEASDDLRVRLMGTVFGEAELLKAAGHEADRAEPARTRWRWRPLPAFASAAALGLGVLFGALVLNGGSSSVNQSTRVTPATVASADHRANVVLRQVGARSELRVINLPAPPPGRIYEVWLVLKGAKAPEPTYALFSVTRQGKGSVGVPGNLHGVDKVLVTDEPLGGSLVPTKTPVIAVQVPSNT